MTNHGDELEISKKIHQIALNYLARSEHCRYTLQEKLLRKGFCRQTVAAVLDNLTQQKLLDDKRFCEAFIARRIRQLYGPVRIAAECRQYGIDEQLINAQLSKDETFWLAMINKLQQKKFLVKKKDKLQQAQLRQIRHLQQRGFTLTQIKESQKSNEILISITKKY